MSDIIDTSFLIDNSQGYHWTIEPFDHFHQPNSGAIIPKGVEFEFDKLMNGRKSNLKNLGNYYGNISDMLELDEFLSYGDRLRGALAKKLECEIDYLGHRGSALSKTDKTVVQAAYDIARAGDKVYVVSSDRGLLEKVEQINLTENLKIGQYSPWRNPRKHDDVALLITDDTFQQLETAPDTTKKYFVVARNINIGAGVTYDAVFAVYANVDNALVFPRVGDSYFMRVVESTMDVKGQFKILTMPIVPLYFSEYGLLLLKRNLNPLTSIEASLLQARRNARRMTPKDKQRLVSASSSFENVRWARLSKEDLRRHDSLTLGKLEDLTRRLSAQIN